MAKRKFEIEVSCIVKVEFDESIMPDDDWRANFYPIYTPYQLAAHLAYNAVANGKRTLYNFDGFADRDPSAAIMCVEDVDTISIESKGLVVTPSE